MIKISSSDLTQIEAARQWIIGIVAEPEPGTIYTGKVANIVDFGRIHSPVLATYGYDLRLQQPIEVFRRVPAFTESALFSTDG